MCLRIDLITKNAHYKSCCTKKVQGHKSYFFIDAKSIEIYLVFVFLGDYCENMIVLYIYK